MKSLFAKNQNKGFTLIELLVVIGILAVLLAIVLIAINPARQFGQANDTKRNSDVNAILNSVGGFAADNKGAIPGAIPTSPTTADAKVICGDIMPNYISAVPMDPGTNNDTGLIDCSGILADTDYTVTQSSGRVTVAAPNTEQGPIISVTR